MEKIGLAADHAGFAYKERVKEHLIEQGYTVVDLGTYNDQSMDYPDVAHPLAMAVEQGDVTMGIALCGSGNGMAMALNKHRGIRAALCWTPQIAVLARQHNNANACALPARFVSIQTAPDIVDAFLRTAFEGGRHQQRVEKIPC
ncbi:MAG: ribose 5-phosphate isomerase B [Bacteroidales bacterium]|nr:ribose 5-phosphate isomerase B [Bacteroidales bacterium]